MNPTFRSTLVPEAVEEALNGDPVIAEMFDWRSSPQGHAFWQEQYETGLTDQGREALQALLVDYRTEEDGTD